MPSDKVLGAKSRLQGGAIKQSKVVKISERLSPEPIV